MVTRALCWRSKLSTIFAFSASICARSTSWPLRFMPASMTIAMVSAACSPPITAVCAFGQEKRKRGS